IRLDELDLLLTGIHILCRGPCGPPEADTPTCLPAGRCPPHPTLSASGGLAKPDARYRIV
ncbi:MAG TPA: hypothetical protein VJM77_07185, partial [Nitrospiria bacterium]|nr:hypothetical protein [Nitrospiria bacterium]